MSKECAAAIRAELKNVYPNQKFSVRSADASCVRVAWRNGPSNAEVEKLLQKYKHGQFDAMLDIYEINPNRDRNIPTVTYVTVTRNVDDVIYEEAYPQLKNVLGLLRETTGLNTLVDGFGDAKTLISRYLRHLDLTNGFNLDACKALVNRV